MKQSNILRINGKDYRGKISDFENMGQIGSGTCGQVYKMQYRPTGHIVAVKVSTAALVDFFSDCYVYIYFCQLLLSYSDKVFLFCLLRL